LPNGHARRRRGKLGPEALMGKRSARPMVFCSKPVEISSGPGSSYTQNGPHRPGPGAAGGRDPSSEWSAWSSGTWPCCMIVKACRFRVGRRRRFVSVAYHLWSLENRSVLHRLGRGPVPCRRGWAWRWRSIPAGMGAIDDIACVPLATSLRKSTPYRRDLRLVQRAPIGCGRRAELGIRSGNAGTPTGTAAQTLLHF